MNDVDGEKKLQFAIVGCGRIAFRHATMIERFGKLAAVCDIVFSKATKMAAQWSVPSYISIDEMLAADIAIDIVVVCTPNGLHAEHSIKAVQAGKHVLCEKPMAITVEDCKRMITAATVAGKLLFIVKQNRYNPPVVAVKKLLDEFKLGKLYSFQLSCFWNRGAGYYQDSWKGTMLLDGGTLFTQFSHFIDLLYWLFGEVSEVKAFTSNAGHGGMIEFEDTGVVILRMQNEMIGTINYSVNACKQNMEGSLTILGEKGTVKIGGQYLNTLEYQQVEDTPPIILPPGQAPNDYGSYQGSMSNHDKVYENVVNVICNKQPMETTMYEALKTVEIISRIYESAN